MLTNIGGTVEGSQCHAERESQHLESPGILSSEETIIRLFFADHAPTAWAQKTCPPYMAAHKHAVDSRWS